MENPKSLCGRKKVGMHVIPPNVLMLIALAMTEGEMKYEGYNWRQTPIKVSDYYDAVWRHIGAYYEGQDIDAQSGLHHVIKAAATLIVLADAMSNDNIIDDRPKPHIDQEWFDKLNTKHVELVERVNAAKDKQ